MKIHLTPEQIELVVTCLEYARCDMSKCYADSAIAGTCKRYCARRVNEVLAKLKPTHETDATV